MGHPAAVRPAHRRHEPAAPEASAPAVDVVVARYLAARDGPYGGLIGPLVCPVLRLSTLVAELARFAPARPIDLSLVVDTGLGAVPKALSTVFSRASLLTPRTVETAAPPDLDAMWLDRVSSSCRRTSSPVVEPRRPHTEDTGGTTAWLEAVRRVAEHGCAPKLRCGGPRRVRRARQRRTSTEFVQVAVETGRPFTALGAARGPRTPRAGTASSTCCVAVARALAGADVRDALENPDGPRSPPRLAGLSERTVKGVRVLLWLRRRTSSPTDGGWGGRRPAVRAGAPGPAFTGRGYPPDRLPWPVRRRSPSRPCASLPESRRADLLPCPGNPAVLAAAASGRSTRGSCRSRTPSRAPCPPSSTGSSTTRRWSSSARRCWRSSSSSWRSRAPASPTSDGGRPTRTPSPRPAAGRRALPHAQVQRRRPRPRRRPRSPAASSTRRWPRRWSRRAARPRVLAADVADNAGAVTRFALLVPPAQLPAPTGHDRTAARRHHPEPARLAARPAHRAGRARHRPHPHRVPPDQGPAAEYWFHLDCLGHVAEPAMGESLAALHRRCDRVRFLGSYPRAPTAGLRAHRAPR